MDYTIADSKKIKTATMLYCQWNKQGKAGKSRHLLAFSYTKSKMEEYVYEGYSNCKDCKECEDS